MIKKIPAGYGFSPPSRRAIMILIMSFAILLLVACDSSEKEEATQGGTEMTLQIKSSAFSDGEKIPTKYSCDGENISPALSWTGVPSDTQSLALIMDDPDAPSGTFVHWVLFNLPGNLPSLAEGASETGIQGMNGARKTGYTGPCPPKGPTHRYFLKLYALDTKLDLKEGASKSDVEKAMQGHILSQGQVMGKYGR